LAFAVKIIISSSVAIGVIDFADEPSKVTPPTLKELLTLSAEVALPFTAPLNLVAVIPLASKVARTLLLLSIK
jgi:hypothetical protein